MSASKFLDRWTGATAIGVLGSAAVIWWIVTGIDDRRVVVGIPFVLAVVVMAWLTDATSNGTLTERTGDGTAVAVVLAFTAYAIVMHLAGLL